MVIRSLLDFVYCNTIKAGMVKASLEYSIGERIPASGHVSLQNSPAYGLFGTTKTIREYDSFEEKEIAAEQTIKNSKARKESEERKQATLAMGKDPKTVKRTRKTRDIESDHILETHMLALCKSLKKGAYANIRSTARLLQQLSSISTAIARGLAQSIRQLIILSGRRTATVDVVRSAIICSLHTSQIPEADKTVLIEYVDSKIDIRSNYTKSQATRAKFMSDERWKQLTPQEQEEKLLEDLKIEQEKKEASIESSKKQAQKSIQKAQERAADSSKADEIRMKLEAVRLVPVAAPDVLIAAPVVADPAQLLAQQQQIYQQQLYQQQMAAQQQAAMMVPQ
jgi:hypothetical protein